MVITGHFIDRNWTLQKRVLSFMNVHPPHNGPALAKEVHRVCNIYGINDKVCSVIVDNASDNDVFRDGLKDVEPIVEDVREGVKYLFGLENRLRSFRVNLKIPSNKLVLDSNMRWNSTYVMLQTTYIYRECFTKYGQDDEAFERYVPNTVEWSLVHEVCEFLEIVLDVTNLISGSNYPTVNLFLLELSRIKELITAQLDKNSKKRMKSMSTRMSMKYDKYWSECDFCYHLDQSWIINIRKA
ncbi:hypothetical protein LIER_00823 [Lithospermum erythrorhizon]|uniref:hAT-like transposase RNase-H fold domain-containing protein n=1 Tax=Lithospermum erythrorhizon TaxID=34254 RepID=A0AAV3NL69_LITER